jgi:hypothetical protein
MNKKQSSAPIGADPYGSFLSSLPRKAIVLGCKGFSYQGKRSISLVYFENGRIHHAECSFEIGKEVKADIEVVSYPKKGGAL